MAGPEKNLQKVSFIAHATRGIIRDQAMRRKTMAAVTAVAVLMLIGGSTVLQETLNPREHAVRFILFWIVCAWFTLTALLLALFDALMVRAEARAARKALSEQFSSSRDSEANDSDATR